MVFVDRAFTIKLFTVVIVAGVFTTTIHLHPYLIFEGKVRSLPY
jgi:hypothetical protein